MTYRELLRDSAARFAASETPFLDAVLFLAESLGATKEKVLAMLPERAEHVPEAFFQMAERRQRGESVAHILGRKEFYGREFIVSESVLSPRQDTEALVEAAFEEGDMLLVRRRRDSSELAARAERAPHVQLTQRGEPGLEASEKLRVLDLCTGSGAVAISIAAERPGWTITASDISRAALEVAKRNAARLVPEAQLNFLESDLFAHIEGTFDLICSNPPYVPRREAAALLEGGWADPILALDGGDDGMDFIRAIVAGSAEYLSEDGVLLLEMDPSQAEPASALLRARGFRDVRTWKDLAGRIRVVGAHHG